MEARIPSRPPAEALASQPPPTAANSAKSVSEDPRYLPGDLVVSRDGRTQYQVQLDGSWKKLDETPSLEDATYARQRHAKDHARVQAKKLEDRSGLVTLDSPASSTLILGQDAEKEFKKLTGGSR